MPENDTTPSGYCQCGCGQQTLIAKWSKKSLRIVAGEPRRYILGHHRRNTALAPPNPSGLCQCGCGGLAPIAKYTTTKYGAVKGHPRRFIYGHQQAAIPFEYQVDPVTGCHLWLGALNRSGYGITRKKNGTRLAHRISYERANGPIPDGMEIDHVKARGCRYRHCINPDHLEPVTRVVNVRRGAATKLSAEDVADIKQRVKAEGRRALSLEYGVIKEHIRRIELGESWG